MGDGTKRSFKELLSLAKLPERTVQVCLRGDLRGEFEELERQLEQAQERKTDSLTGDGTAELAERMEAIRAEMRDSTHPFRLRALPGPRYRAFMAEHPSRVEDGEVNKLDLYFGFNMVTGFEPLVRLCLLDPELDDDGWAQLMEKLTDRQFDQLAFAAWELNRGDIDIPFSSAASELIRSSAAG